MRKLTLNMTMTFDGFFAGPNNELDWMAQTPDQDLTADMVAFYNTIDEGFIGYPTGIGMIAYWATVAKNPSASEGEKGIAKSVNKLHPILVSNRDEKLPMDGAELIVAKDDGELNKAVTRIKERPGRDIGLSGGIRTAQTFVRLGLIDEYRIMVHPVFIGNGKSVFTAKANLELVSVKSYPSGVIRVIYRPRQTRGKGASA